MSVLSTKRTESKAEYVNNANEIYINTIRFLTRISNRYSRLISEPISKLASDLLTECEKVNEWYKIQKSYFDNFNDHNCVLRLNQLYYNLFGGAFPCSNFSTPPMRESA